MGITAKLQCVVPGGRARCSIRMGNQIPITTIIITTITPLTTTTTNLQDGDPPGTAGDKRRAKVKL